MNKFYCIAFGIVVFTIGLITGLSSVSEPCVTNSFYPDVAQTIADGLPFTILVFILMGLAAVFMTMAMDEDREEDVNDA